MALRLVPITFREACEFVAGNHRHHQPPRGCKFCIGARDGDRLVGVVIAGRPVSRHWDDGYTAEVTRLCTDGTKNAASMLYAAAGRAARAMGYSRLITYTLEEEPGTSLVATGFKLLYVSLGGEWGRESRPRKTKAPTGPKKVWELSWLK